MITKKLWFLMLVFINIFPCKAQNKIEHKLIFGYNFGASLPISIPAEVRRINAYNLKFTPQSGYGIVYHFNKKWALQSGVLLDYKGMKVTDEVKYIYTDVVMDGESIKGHFVGKNETKIKLGYITIPLHLAYSFNDAWVVKAGGYISYCFSADFTGTVWDGYLREGEDRDIANSMKIEIQDKGDAVFDFGNEVRDIDLGLSLGVERNINEKIGISATINWGLSPIFNSGFKGMDFNMYNVYTVLGMTYKL